MIFVAQTTFYEKFWLVNMYQNLFLTLSSSRRTFHMEQELVVLRSQLVLFSPILTIQLFIWQKQMKGWMDTWSWMEQNLIQLPLPILANRIQVLLSTSGWQTQLWLLPIRRFCFKFFNFLPDRRNQLGAKLNWLLNVKSTSSFHLTFKLIVVFSCQHHTTI